MARMPLTSCGRSSAPLQPITPAWEWTSSTAGPMRSSSFATGGAVQLLDHRLVADGLDLRGVELVEARIALRCPCRATGCASRPAARASLVSGEVKRCVALPTVRRPRLAVDVGEEPGAAAPGLIDDIDRIAVGDEIVGPAAAAVRRAEEVDAGLAAAVDHHHRIGPRLVLRHLILDEHLADHDGVLADLDVAAGHRERALVGDLQGLAGVEQAILRLCGCERQQQCAGGCANPGNRHQSLTMVAIASPRCACAP